MKSSDDRMLENKYNLSKAEIEGFSSGKDENLQDQPHRKQVGEFQ